LNQDNSAITPPGQELSLQEIECLLMELKKLNTKTIDLTGGGEPFLRKDILDILALVKKYRFECTLTTNGVLLDQKLIQKLIAIGIDDICFSLDGPTPEINDFLRGDGVYERVVRNIELFNKLKGNNGTEKPVIRMATVITNVNYEYLDQIADLAMDLEIAAINFAVLVEWDSNKNLSTRNVDDLRLREILNRTIAKTKSYGIYTNIPALLEFGLHEHAPPKFCFAPWTLAFINTKGTVLLCCTLAALYKYTLGNIRDTSFTSIWFGSRMNQFRENIKKGKLPEQCIMCIPEFTQNYNAMYDEMERVSL
jgi:radical SAM protein with 4Fe4S-binding SPASM domain